MSWVVFAFSGPVLWAISVHLDKYLVERFFKESNVAVMLLFTAFVGLVLLPFIWIYEPSVTAPGARSIALIILSGLLYMAAMLLYLQALQTEEASVVAPYFQASPLFGFVLAYLVLGETLSWRQLVGGVMIVLGALIVSVRFRYGVRMFKARLAALMLTCGFAAALSGLIFKIYAIDVEFWTTTFWMYVGEALFGCALLLVPIYRRQLVTMLRVNTAALLSINGSNELINLGGGLGNRYALMFAPLSLVQAIGSTTTLFVFAFGVVLSVFWPGLAREDLSGHELAKRGWRRFSLPPAWRWRHTETAVNSWGIRMTKPNDERVEIVDTHEVYGGWSKLLVATIRVPDGRIIKREIEDHGEAVCVLPYHPLRKTAVLVRQSRVPVLYAAGQEQLLEAVAGVIEDIDAATCAHREVMEEALLKLDALEPVFTAFTMPGLSTEYMHFFLAVYSGEPRPEVRGGVDEDEYTVAVEVGLAELARMADENRLPDTKTLLLLQTLRLRRPELFA